MSNDYFIHKKKSSLSNDHGVSAPTTPSTPSGTSAPRSYNALSSKVTSVLSASYADHEIRDALVLLDGRKVDNSAETRRQFRLEIQKEVIESNGDIIQEFGQVAEVREEQSQRVTYS